MLAKGTAYAKVEGRNSKALSGQEQKGTNEGSLDEVGTQPCGLLVIGRASQHMGPQELKGCRGQKGRFKHREQNSGATREPTGELVTGILHCGAALHILPSLPCAYSPPTLPHPTPSSGPGKGLQFWQLQNIFINEQVSE